MTAPVRPTAFSLASQDLDFLSSATGNGTIFYNRTSQVTFENGPCRAFSSDGTRLAMGYWDATGLIWDLRPAIGRAGMPARALSPTHLNQLWSDLGGEDAAEAHAAIWTLVAAPEKALRVLDERLKSADQIDPQRMHQLLTDLDSPKFAVRQGASRELEQIADQAEPLLREVLEKRLPLEARRRIEEMLRLPRVLRNPECLRCARAIQVLEQIGTPEARQILQRLAGGASQARLTQEAKASLERLAKRPAATP